MIRFWKRVRILRPQAAQTQLSKCSYFSEKTVNATDDPYQYWGVNRLRFPNLAEAATKYLCAPCTSVESERLFSTVSNILDEKRNRLTAEKIEMLAFLNKNLSLLQKWWGTFYAPGCSSQHRIFSFDFLSVSLFFSFYSTINLNLMLHISYFYFLHKYDFFAFKGWFKVAHSHHFEFLSDYPQLRLQVLLLFFHILHFYAACVLHFWLVKFIWIVQ